MSYYSHFDQAAAFLYIDSYSRAVPSPAHSHLQKIPRQSLIYLLTPAADAHTHQDIDYLLLLLARYKCSTAKVSYHLYTPPPK